MSFQVADGRQFVVIAAGGSVLLRSPIGDALVAFAPAP
jgi:glucose dehydrogenase